ncbi:hypothetical protein POSPLADRAFT_1144166 [Postia placenta MAD-698-R-SB12]|uniref:D-isomer specific 2-hydroxyacid dehydrogenase NAD-binding domain-containing protein n=1 Tax=Postia placenta MAD-698-R-SB12 TaxID=670580 RepID=A0A1X6MZN6_9APHY|nr:hypothetical protein POSPLADRAFT_1144166 [Postia placenta MAD-698-R-SB12]OSX61824.1 hypothetical protein POSPLADRAFT_1144166 [Postia placenta MAD-698-R-SB12]
MTLPRVILCGKDVPVWTKAEAKEVFNGIADVVLDESTSRADFLASFQPGGPFEGAVGFYRRNNSTARIGRFDKDLVSALPSSVKWIAHNGAGYDQVDVAACQRKGIYVSNTPGAVDDATATTALYLLISAFRSFSKAERDIRAGAWKTLHPPASAHDLTGKVVAILGLGGIGLRFADLVHAFPMRVLYHSRRKFPHAPEWCEYYSADRLDEMLATADVLSIHVPLNEHTVELVDKTMIRKLKKGAIIINTARCRVIDEEEMMRALEDGHLGAIGLDVFYDEPNVNPRWFDFPNATLLPHVGTATCDTIKSMELRALGNLRNS